jgi:hypothetical protein
MLQLKSDMRARLMVSTMIGVAAGIYCWFLLARLQLGSADFHWAIASAQSLLKGGNPYQTSSQLYPLPVALLGLPFVAIRPEIAGGIFYGASSAALAFGLTRSGYTRLLIFLAFPYWAGLITAQWPPLLMAGAFFPVLMAVTLAKPQIGLPLFLTHFSKKGLAGCIVLGLASLVVMPTWPRYWIHQIGHYNHFYPILIFPGPLLLLALLRYRDRDSLLLIITACMPQRWFYDTFILWLIPKSRKEILATVAVSWGAGIWRWYHTPVSFDQVGFWTVLFVYLPLLFVVLGRYVNEKPSEKSQKSIRSCDAPSSESPTV